MPRVSIVVPVYNNERYLDQCLLSLRSQTYRDLEIIAVDDASSDASAALAERHAEADPRVRVLRLEHAALDCGARKAGILASTGTYVTLIDQDDELVQRPLSAWWPTPRSILPTLSISPCMWRPRTRRRAMHKRV